MYKANENRNSKIFNPKFTWIILPVICFLIGIYIRENHYRIKDDAETTISPITERKCVPPSIDEFPPDLFSQEERQQGYVAIHILITSYLCLTLAIVCDQYFVPSLEIITDYLKVPKDIAGATFMAIGTSSPELYSAVIGSFVTEGDIGIGTIVGSAVFNILGVTSVTGLLLWKTEAHVDWYPVSRDCLIYIFSVTTLICIIQDNIVTWFESSLLILMFLMYIMVMVFDRSIKESCEETIQDINLWWKKYYKIRTTSLKVHRSRSLSGTAAVKANQILSSSAVNSQTNSSKQKFETDFFKSLKTPETLPEVEVHDSDSDDEDLSPWEIPSESHLQQLIWVISWPVLVLISLTIPNCKKPNESVFPYTFLSSVIWIGVLSYLSSWMVTIIGHTFGLPDSVAGITLLAAGISVPEVIASVIVVKNGMANMAFSNLIGSNIFDILFCLGLPWLIKTLFLSGGKLIVHSSALTYSAATLLSTVVLLFITLGTAGWKLNWKVGLACLSLYAMFLIIACACELNMFGNMNPPTCQYDKK